MLLWSRKLLARVLEGIGVEEPAAPGKSQAETGVPRRVRRADGTKLVLLDCAYVRPGPERLVNGVRLIEVAVEAAERPSRVSEICTAHADARVDGVF